MWPDWSLGEAVARQRRDVELVRRHAYIEEMGTNPVGWTDRNYPPYPIRAPLFKPALPIVSSSLRGFAAIMFGIIADDDQVEDDQTTELVGKRTNLIRFGAKLPKEAFEQIG
jgi:hypothetical protein